MPDAGLDMPRAEMHARAVKALEELADGSFGIRMRHEAAARILVTLRRVALLAAGGEIPEVAAPCALAAIAGRWDASAMTAREYAEGLPADELALLLAEAPAWAEARRALLPGVRTSGRPSRTGTA